MTAADRKKPVAEQLTVRDVELIVEMGRKRIALMDELEMALKAHRTEDVYRVGRILCGLPPES